MKPYSLLFALVLIGFGCSTPPQPPTPAEPPPNPVLNYPEIQDRLGLEFGENDTGFKEKSFDACDLGKALETLKEPLSDCHHASFVLVQFQLSCRGSEESASIISEADLAPVKNQSLNWEIGKLTGQTLTDFQGRGIIRVISNTPVRKSFLRLSTGRDFLNMRVEQATAIVTPPSWCD